MELKDFKTDKDKEIEGVWEELDDGCSVLVARWGNPKMTKAYTRFPRGLRQRMENGQVDDETSRVGLAKIVAKTILLNWKGLKEDKEEVKYSEKECIRILTDYPDFYTLVFQLSNEFQLYHDKSVADTTKNLKSD